LGIELKCVFERFLGVFDVMLVLVVVVMLSMTAAVYRAIFIFAH
jgi:hypothetical protein